MYQDSASLRLILMNKLSFKREMKTVQIKIKHLKYSPFQTFIPALFSTCLDIATDFSLSSHNFLYIYMPLL